MTAEEAAGRFRLPGRPGSARPWGDGHIHDTYVIELAGPAPSRAILQRMNRTVFPDPEGVMANVARVLDHLKAKVPDPRRRLTLFPALDGSPLWRSPEGEAWRAFAFVEGTRVLQTAGSPDEAYQAARAFGAFLAALSDLPGPELAETLPDFHDTPGRLKHLERAAAEDGRGRAKEAAEELAFARARQESAHALAEAGGPPRRPVHNDTKINNVLFDAATGEALCVLDLDTVMPGLAAYDFGDLARTAAGPAAEDEPDLSRVAVRREALEALARGFLDGAGEVLGPAERESLALGPRVIAFETGVRFLTDYLEGDVYFKTSRPGQNLDRCRAQFRLAELLEREEGFLARVLR